MTKRINPTDIIDDVNPSPMLRKLRNDNTLLRRKIDELKLEMGETEAVFDTMKAELGAITVLNPVVHNSKTKGARVGAPITAVVVLGDWHIGEYTESDQIEEFNQFSWDIAQKRAYYLGKKFISWVGVQRTSAVIDELVVIVVGDMISGDIHPELQATNEFPTPVQAVRAGVLVSKTIAELSAHFKKVRVEFITLDNHSRLTRKPQWKDGGKNSYGYIVGWVAMERLRAIKNVKFNLHIGMKTLVEVQGFKYLCMHGHQIKGWAGIPWYGTDRQVAKESKSRRRKPNQNFDKVIMGHFHQPLWTTDYIINGSLSGTSELDHGQGRHAEPCQVAFLVHPKYGEMNKIEFEVQHGDDEDFGGAEIALQEKSKYEEIISGFGSEKK